MTSFKFGNLSKNCKFSRFPGLAKKKMFENGVSSFGLCINQSCIQYNKEYLQPHGYGFYRPNIDKTICSSCKTAETEMTGFVFSRANVLVRYKKEGRVKVRTRLLSETMGGLKGVRSSREKSQLVNYVFIEVFSCLPGCPIPTELYERPKATVPVVPN